MPQWRLFALNTNTQGQMRIVVESFATILSLMSTTQTTSDTTENANVVPTYKDTLLIIKP